MQGDGRRRTSRSHPGTKETADSEKAGMTNDGSHRDPGKGSDILEERTEKE